MAGIQTSKAVPWPGTEETLTLRGWRAPVGGWRRRDRRAGARRGPRRTRRPQRRRARRARASAAPSADPGGWDSPLRRSQLAQPARGSPPRRAACPISRRLSSMKVVSRRKGEVHEAGDRSQDVAEVVRDLPREPADRLPLLALDPPSLELKRSGSRRALPRTAVCRSPLHVNRAVATMFSDTGRKIAVRLIADAERYVAQRLEPEAASGRRTGSCRAGLSCLRRVVSLVPSLERSRSSFPS